MIEMLVDFEGETGYGNQVSEERKQILRKFVELVQPNEHLYAKRKKGYSKSSRNCLTWQSIADILFGVQIKHAGDRLKDLFGKLRDKFGKERKKVEISKPRSGAGANVATYIPDWFLYKNLLFLGDHIKPRKTTTNIHMTQLSSNCVPILQTNSSGSGPSSVMWPPSQVAFVCSNTQSSESFIDCDDPLSPLASTNCGFSVAEPYTSEGKAGALSPASSALRAMAISPAKTVPPTDIVKKRKRSAEKENEVSKEPSNDMSKLATSLSLAIDKFTAGKECDTAPAAHTSKPEDTLTLSVVASVCKVPVEQKLSCVIEMLQVAQKYLS